MAIRCKKGVKPPSDNFETDLGRLKFYIVFTQPLKFSEGWYDTFISGYDLPTLEQLKADQAIYQLAPNSIDKALRLQSQRSEITDAKRLALMNQKA